MENNSLKKEDYEEPCCPLNMNPTVVRIPIPRVLEKLDEYFGKQDFEAAERHLKYWLDEAKTSNDTQGALTVLNEQIGFYRKLGKEAQCLAAIDASRVMIEKSELADTVTYATTLINQATGYKAFGRAADALPLYRKAQEIYERDLTDSDERVGGLYNNMALALTELGLFREAEKYYHQALGIMAKQDQGDLEVAITCLNLADLAAAELGLVEAENIIADYVQKAADCLNQEHLVHDTYYAFVCDKCAPVFGSYGYFLLDQEFSERARDIYERARLG